MTLNEAYQTQQPKDHIQDLGFGEQVLSKLDACQRLQKSYGPVQCSRREKQKQQTLGLQ